MSVRVVEKWTWNQGRISTRQILGLLEAAVVRVSSGVGVRSSSTRYDRASSEARTLLLDICFAAQICSLLCCYISVTLVKMTVAKADVKEGS